MKDLTTSSSGVSRGMTNRTLAAAVAAVAIACYLNSLGNGFVSDDQFLILEHPFVKSVADWPAIFTSGHYAGSGGYRPLTTLSFALNYFFSQAHPFAYHVTNVVLHAFNCVLVFFLFVRLSTSVPASFAGALVFAVHPIHSEAVDWISGRAELLATAFFLIAWLFYFAAMDGHRSRRGLLGASLVAFFAALLCKENALILPFALLLGIVSDRRHDWQKTAPKWSSLLLYLGVAPCYFAFRWGLYRHSFLRRPAQIDFVDNPLAHLSIFSRVFTAIKIQGNYLALLFWPRKLCGDYSFDSVSLVTHWFDAAALISVGCFLLIAFLAAFSFVRRGALWVGILFYALAIFPVSNLLVAIGTIKAERLLYLPSVGFCLAVVAIASCACNHWRETRSSHRWIFVPASAAFVCLLLAGAGRTWTRNSAWHDDDTFWADTAISVPQNIKAQLHYGYRLLQKGEREKAIAAFKKAHEIDPGSEDAVLNLGASLIQAGRSDEGAVLLEEAIRRAPNRAAYHANLGLADLALGNLASGIRELQRASELNPDNVVDHLNLGLALSKSGDTEAAVREYRRAVELNSNYAEAWNALGAALIKLGRPEEARAALRKALEIKPHYSEAIYNMTLLESPH